MWAGKNAISVLKELADTKVIENPQYTIDIVPSGVRCILKCGGLNATAVGINKHIVKHECAQQVLSQIHNTKPATIITNETKQVQSTSFNAIGKLNELCSGNNTPYPEYIDHGYLDGNFIIECKCLNYSSKGKSLKKKQAKQLAATEMLDKLSETDFQKSKLTDIEIANVLEVFAGLKSSLANTTKIEEVDELLEETNIMPDVVPVNVQDEKELVQLLHAAGIKYEFKELQHNPLVLAIKASDLNNKNYTFLESRGNYIECRILLLQSLFDACCLLNG